MRPTSSSPASWADCGPLWIALVLLLSAPAGAAAPPPSPNRFDDALASHAAKVRADPSSPLAFLETIEVVRLWDVTTPGLVEKTVAGLAGVGKLHPQARIMLSFFEIAAAARAGDHGKAAALVAARGIVTGWMAVGPFDNEDLEGHGRAVGPELEAGEPFQASASWAGDEREVAWHAAKSDPLSGVVNLARFLYPSEKVCGFAGARVEAPASGDVVLWGASAGTLALWVDGAKVIDDPVERPFGPMRHAARVKLKKGAHQLLAKVCVSSGDWKLVVAATDAKGSPRPLRPVAPGKDGGAPPGWKPPAAPPAHKPFPTALATLAKKAQEKDAPAAALGEAARMLVLTLSDDRKQSTAQDWAARAAEVSGSCRDLLVLAAAAKDDNVAAAALAECLDREPGNADAAYLSARRRGPAMGFADYSSMVLAMAKKFPRDPLVRMLRAGLLDEEGLPVAAFAALEKLREEFGPLPVLLDRLAQAAREGGTHAEALALLAQLVAARGDNGAILLEWARSLLDEGKWDEAKEAAGRLRGSFTAAEDLAGPLAAIYDAMNMRAESLALLVEETELSPHDPAAWEELGKHYARAGKKDDALRCFLAVLELNPQNAKVRQYVASLDPEEKFEEGAVKDAASIRAAAAKLPTPGGGAGASAVDATCVVDQEIDRVWANGMSARFVQRAVRVDSDQGAKMQAYQVIGWAPSRQDLEIVKARVLRREGGEEDFTGRFTIPVVEEAYRLYYDDANEVVELPSLEPGDIVDLQYKITDSAVRNLWEKHFGNIVPVADRFPKDLFRYEIIADAAVTLHVDTPQAAGLAYVAAHEDGRNVHAWEARGVPPIVPEPEMPPLMEVSPLIRVSTFGSWEELGTWWWGIASPQMAADKNIRERTAAAIKGKKTQDEKVRAIFDWVVRSTRYVGLEFGVHGFKPYRSAEVAARGFGDCKDKASLLYVMLTEAGIDAAVALVRTRGSGLVSPSFPSQFHFDHAIAAVPAAGLFLDGTVNYLGAGTLPPADQGVFSLVVSGGKVEQRWTPVSPPAGTGQALALTMTLEEDGDATIDAVIASKGSVNAYERHLYQTEGTRDERLEKELAAIFPGVSLLSSSFSGLDDYDADVTVHLTAAIPAIAMTAPGELQLTALPSYALFKKYASRSARAWPVVVEPPRVLADRYVYKAPPGYVFETAPAPVSAGSADAGYSYVLAAAIADPSTLVVESTLTIAVFRIEPAAYGPFRDFCRAVDDATTQRIHVAKKKPVSP